MENKIIDKQEILNRYLKGGAVKDLTVEYGAGITIYKVLFELIFFFLGNIQFFFAIRSYAFYIHFTH